MNFKYFVFLIACINIYTSCISTKHIGKTIYVEIDSQEFNPVSFQSNIKKGAKGFIVKNARLYRVYGSEYKVNEIKIDGNYFERLNPNFEEQVEDDKKYTLYLKVKKYGNFLYGCKYITILEKIEGLRTVDEINAELLEREKAEEIEKQNKREIEKKLIEAKKRTHNEKGQFLAKGYIYHGVDEKEKNEKLFNGGALEEGHAYYISPYIVIDGGNMGATGNNHYGSFYKSYPHHLVDYVNRKVKAEIISVVKKELGLSGVEILPISVVIAGGKAPIYTPVILGLVEDGIIKDYNPSF